MTTTNCDPRALEIAHCLHRTEQPELTILFGSRARGDYEDGRSDIDIMLVQEHPPSEEQESRTRNQAETSAQELYRQAVPVQIIWKTSDEFNRMRRSVNHLVARALRDGVMMSRDTGDDGSIYDDNGENGYEYEWMVTDERYRHAEKHLNTFNNLVELGDDDDMIGQHAQGAMEHALKALISATKTAYNRIHDIDELTTDALRADTDFQFSQGIHGAIYNQYAGSQDYHPTQNPISDIANYRAIVNTDVQAILARVREIRGSQPE